MTTFNTGNPVPSTESKDLSDNAENFDNAVNLQSVKWTDRLGVIRDTVNGRIQKMGYTVPIAYAAAITFAIDDNVKTVEESGVIYAPFPSALPFTTSGTFVGDDDARFFVVQGVLVDQLINDLSQSYTFPTVALFESSLIEFPDGKTIHLNDRDADFTKITGIGTANTANIIASTGVNQSIELIIKNNLCIIDEFGGLGDNSTDNIVARDAAITYLEDKGEGGVIHHPIGQYKYSTTTSIAQTGTKLIILTGVASAKDNIASGSEVIYTAATGDALEIGSLISGAGGSAIGATMMNLTVRHDNPTGIAYGLSLNKVFRNYIEGCSFFDFTFAGSAGLVFYDDPLSTILKPVISYIQSCTFKNNYDHVLMSGLANIDYTFDSCIFIDHDNHAIHSKVNAANKCEVKQLNVLNCEFEGGTGNAIYLANGTLVCNIENSYFEWVVSRSPIVIESELGNQNGAINVDGSFFQGPIPLGEGLVNVKNIEGLIFKGNYQTNNLGAAYFAVHNLGGAYATGLDITSPQTVFGQTRLSSFTGITEHNYKSDEAVIVFSPGIAFGGGSTGIVYSTQVSRYKKIDDVVHVWMNIVMTSKGTSTGNITLTGLPFTSQGAIDNRASGNILTRSLNFIGLTGAVFGRLDEGTANVELYQMTATGESAITDANVSNNTAIAFYMAYRVSP